MHNTTRIFYVLMVCILFIYICIYIIYYGVAEYDITSLLTAQYMVCMHVPWKAFVHSILSNNKKCSSNVYQYMYEL